MKTSVEKNKLVVNISGENEFSEFNRNTLEHGLLMNASHRVRSMDSINSSNIDKIGTNFDQTVVYRSYKIRLMRPRHIHLLLQQTCREEYNPCK